MYARSGKTAPRCWHRSAFPPSQVRSCGVFVGSELPLLTSPSFITPYLNGIFPSVFRRIQRLHNSLVWRVDSSVQNYECLTEFLCDFVWAVHVGVRMEAFVNPCVCLGINLPSHHTHTTNKGLSVPLHSKMYHCFFLRTWQDRCKRLVVAAASGKEGGNVNSRECDPHHSSWFRRGVWKGERSLTAVQPKRWNIISCDKWTLLKLPFEPIAIVCQLPMWVMDAFSLTYDLCRLNVSLWHSWLLGVQGIKNDTVRNDNNRWISLSRV